MLRFRRGQRRRFWVIGAGDIQPQQVDAEHKRGRLLKLGKSGWDLCYAWHVLPIPKGFIACRIETRGVGWQIHRRLFQIAGSERRQRAVGIWVEKRSDWRMGVSVIERPFWNGLLPLWFCRQYFETICLVCAQADKWSIPF